MNKNFLMYGLGILLIGLLIYGSWDSIKADDAYSNKVGNSIAEKVHEVNTEEGKIKSGSENREGNDEREDIEKVEDNALELDGPKENIEDEDDVNEEKAIEEQIVEEVIKEDGKYDIVEVFNTKSSSVFSTNIKYEKDPIDFSYVVISGKSANIRKEPTLESMVLRKSRRKEKMNLYKAVKGQYIKKFDSDIWYKVYWEDKGEIVYGYMLDKLGEARSFRVNEVEELLNKLKTETDSNQTAYISNYKNRSGSAPLCKGKSVDDYGTRRYQSAPAYMDPDYKSVFRYIPDGSILSVLEEKDNFLKVSGLNFEGQYWVPKKYVSIKNSIAELKKVVVVDRKNQNETVFEYSEDKWNLVSYGLATTGKKGRYRLETPLGYYMVIEKKPSFLYYGDGTKKIAGYAPYAVRFTGGMYIHGIPTNFRYVEGKRIKPSASETSSTIGTTPLSHGCVRNNTSHAKFLYEWLGVGESAVIVIDELPSNKLSSFKGRNATSKKSISKW